MRHTRKETLTINDLQTALRVMGLDVRFGVWEMS